MDPSNGSRDDPLTPYGKHQVEALGKEWANVRIDAMYSSPLKRAYDTAKAIANHNVSHPEIQTDERLEEQYHGSTVEHYMKTGQWQSVARERSGKYNGGPPNRAHRPGGGGESLNDVAFRGTIFSHTLPLKHGAIVQHSPTDNLPERCNAEDLLDGIPHIVLVSHNIFLCELYDTLVSWNQKDRIETTDSYRNAGW